MPDSPPGSIPLSWYDVLRHLMCELYRSLGGDCADLGWTDGGWSATGQINDAFQTNGPPTFATPEEEAAFLASLDTLEAHIHSPDSTLPPQLTDEIQQLIDDLRAALQNP